VVLCSAVLHLSPSTAERSSAAQVLDLDILDKVEVKIVAFGAEVTRFVFNVRNHESSSWIDDVHGRVQQRLQERNFVDPGERCAECHGAPKAGCCLQWFEAGARVAESELNSDRGDLEVRAHFAGASGFDAGLQALLFRLPVTSSQRHRLIDELSGQGIYKRSQLEYGDFRDTLDDFEAVARKMFEDEQASAKRENLRRNQPVEALRREVDMKEQLLVNSEAQRASKKLISELVWLQKQANGHEKVEDKINEMKDMLESQIAPSLQKQELQINSDLEAKDMESVDERSGKLRNKDVAMVSRSVNLKDLSERLGLFRGLDLYGAVGETMKSPVVEVKTDESATFDSMVPLIPDEETTETTFQCESAQAMNSIEKFVSTWGTSSFDSSRSGLNAALNVGIAGVGVDVSGSRTSAKKTDKSASGDDKGSNETAKETKTYQKTRYFGEPRALIKIPPEMLEPTEAYREALREASDEMFEVNEKVDEVLDKAQEAAEELRNQAQQDGMQPQGGDIYESMLFSSLTGWASPLQAPFKDFLRDKIGLEEVKAAYMKQVYPGLVAPLLEQFGSHVCTNVVLGGYWKVKAKYSSDSSTSINQVSSMASEAIETAASSSLKGEAKVGWGGPGGWTGLLWKALGGPTSEVKVSGERSKDKGELVSTGNGTSSENGLSEQNSVMDVTQEINKNGLGNGLGSQV